MYLINFFPSPLIISVVVVIFLLSLSFPESACSEDISYSNCKSSFECGRLRHISYPFWGNGQPYYCGHPKFELHCERGKPTIEIKSQKYLVLHMHHETPILKIARLYDWLNESIVCPESNTTMDCALFRYTFNNQNATLLYDCDPEFLPPQTSELLCMKNGKPEYASFVTDTNLANRLASRCEFSVVVSVLATAAQGLADHSLYTNDVLGQGFEVEWIVDGTHCRACIVSGGICRYNWTSHKFFCACGESGDQAYPISCPNPPEPPPAAPSLTASNFAESSMCPSSFHDFS
ncbi:Leaf rust 10 disease resistance locus receptor-like protein kinase-like 2.7 [Vitis vinifera]|uniref:non-specific serine/threonine protein kinase n=1 Tax=Vitis vinifera TaxID=29760 RepID=A0A438JYC0_VITVI|nr:Leaf rust 10 disease resistance locus receptor-like protein kinase-like 2.7 [Vitis vinifera]